MFFWECKRKERRPFCGTSPMFAARRQQLLAPPSIVAAVSHRLPSPPPGRNRHEEKARADTRPRQQGSIKMLPLRMELAGSNQWSGPRVPGGGKEEWGVNCDDEPMGATRTREPRRVAAEHRTAQNANNRSQTKPKEEVNRGEKARCPNERWGDCAVWQAWSM